MEWEEGTECHRAPTCIHRSNTRYPAGRANGLVRWIQARPFLERGAENRCEISNRQRAKKPNKSMNEREDFELDVTIGAAVDAADPDDNPVAALPRLLRLGLETIGRGKHILARIAAEIMEVAPAAQPKIEAWLANPGDAPFKALVRWLDREAVLSNGPEPDE
jgi:hypothetical protein